MTGQSKNTTRRAFLGMGAAAVSAKAFAARSKAQPKRKPGELLKVGLVNGEWSHSENCWIKLVNGLYNDRGNGPFLGKINHHIRDDCIIYTKFKGKDRVFRCEYHINWDNFIWSPMLFYIQEVFEKGFDGLIDTHDVMIDKMKLFVAGFRSILRENGEFVELDSLDEDWAVGCPWGQKFFKDTDDYRAYTKLLGKEKGEIRATG